MSAEPLSAEQAKYLSGYLAIALKEINRDEDMILDALEAIASGAHVVVPAGVPAGEAEKVLELLRIGGYLNMAKYEQALNIVRSWPQAAPGPPRGTGEPA